MEDKLIVYIKEELLGHETDLELLPTDDLLSTGLLDSMGIVRLIAFIEETFETSIPPEDMTIENFLSVEAISNYLEGRK